MNMRFWISWVALWSAMPVFSSFLGMATHRWFNDTLPVQPHHATMITLTAITATLLYLAAPYLVLRRYIPNYRAHVHAGVVAAFLGAGTLVWVAAMFLHQATWSGLSPTRMMKDFTLAVSRTQSDAPILLSDALTLPWAKLWVVKAISTAAVFAAPTLMICATARKTRAFPKVLGLVVLAGIVVATSDALFDLFRIHNLHSDVLNGNPWSTRIGAMATWSISAAIGASISAVGLNRLLVTTGTRTGWHLVPATIALLWGVSLATDYTLGPTGWKSGFAGLRKALSTAPKEDVSTGKIVLTYTHSLSTSSARFPNETYADFQVGPDSKTAIILEGSGKNGRQLAAFDIASGTRIASLTAPLTQHERAFYTWARDGTHLAVRTRGGKQGDTRYPRYETQITLFALPAYQQVGQWTSSDPSCRHADYGQTNLTQDSAGNLVVLCFGGEAAPLAIVLSLPALDLRQVRDATGAETRSRVDGVLVRNGVTFLKLRGHSNGHDIVLADLSNPDRTVVFDAPQAPDRGGELTFQRVTTRNLPEDQIGLTYCGGTDKVTNPPVISNQAAWGPSFCRIITYALANGSYLGQVDSAETRIIRPAWVTRETTIGAGPWQITGIVDPASKTGELILREAETGQVLQTIESHAQIPLAMSPNGKHLFTHRLEDRSIGVYAVQSQP